MVVENLRIDVTPGGVPLVIHVSQYDAGLRQFNFTPYDKGVQMAKIAGASVTMEATKPDGYAVQHPCTYNADGTITYVLQEQLAAVEGQVWSKLTWRDSSGNILGAKAIVWAVDMAGIEDGAIVSDSDLPLVEQAAEFAATYEEKLAEAVASIHVIPGQVVIDGTLTIEGAAADAKVTGDRIRALEAGQGSGLSDTVKSALLNCFANVAWSVENGRRYYNVLRGALYPESVFLVSIEATYTPASGFVVYESTPLDNLRQYITVIGTYSDESTRAVTDYALSGTLEAGTTSQITVTVDELTSPIQVSVSNLLYDWDFTSSLYDRIQNKYAAPMAASGHSEPARGSSGVVFNEPTQILSMGDADDYTIDILDTTVEFEVAQFAFQGNPNYHTRLLMNQINDTASAVGAGALIFRHGYGWTAYGYTSPSQIDSNYRAWNSDGWGDLYSPDAINALNGKTVKVYYGADGYTRKLYVDGVLKGTMKDLYFSYSHEMYRLRLGGGTSLAQASGDQCYNMTIPRLRIYRGEV